MENKFARGKIYRIVCNVTNKQYIGSTIKSLSQRLSNHVGHYKLYKSDEHFYLSSYDVLENDDYYIALIEKYACKSKEELHRREGYQVKQYECTNRIIPGRSDAEYYVDNKESILTKCKAYRQSNKAKISKRGKEYYSNHVDEINAKHKVYREANKDAASQYGNIFREANKDMIAQRQKECYLKNKERLYDKVDCACGSTVTNASMWQHKRSRKHMSFDNNNI